jgi:hypothetical protein
MYFPYASSNAIPMCLFISELPLSFGFILDCKCNVNFSHGLPFVPYLVLQSYWGEENNRTTTQWVTSLCGNWHKNMTASWSVKWCRSNIMLLWAAYIQEHWNHIHSTWAHVQLQILYNYIMQSFTFRSLHLILLGEWNPGKSDGRVT